MKHVRTFLFWCRVITRVPDPRFSESQLDLFNLYNPLSWILLFIAGALSGIVYGFLGIMAAWRDLWRDTVGIAVEVKHRAKQPAPQASTPKLDPKPQPEKDVWPGPGI